MRLNSEPLSNETDKRDAQFEKHAKRRIGHDEELWPM
jgi:hypothetical protein